MDLSISSATNIGRIHIKGTYIIAAACAVALTAAVVAGNVSWEHRSGAGTGGGAAPAGAVADTNMPNQSVVYYVARSPQEPAELASLLSSEGAAYGMSLNASVLVDGPETRSMIATATGELMQAGVPVRVVEPVESATKTVSKEEATSTRDAAIMAGVISSEHGAWAFESASR